MLRKLVEQFALALLFAAALAFFVASGLTFFLWLHGYVE